MAKQGRRMEIEAPIGCTSWVQEQEAAGVGRPHQNTKDQPRCDNEARISGKEALNMVEHMDAKGAQWKK
eukprot:2809296-Pyramimonas_sp.AAC.1